MSGKPNPLQIEELRNTLRTYQTVRRSLARLDDEIKQKQQLRNECIDALGRGKQEITRLMNAMDVASPGNHGWEARHFEMLLMLAEE